MVSLGAIRALVVQVVFPLASTAWGGQSVLAAPLIVKVTVPDGFTGVTVLAVTVAVKVTDWPTLGDADEEVNPSRRRGA